MVKYIWEMLDVVEAAGAPLQHKRVTSSSLCLYLIV